ncbi:EF-hand and coiled-coil domain-containing protein 1 [Sorex araneus]|uniref:EF-hand and coiled-coil domain-containing protein 1 n=1 Tax=Sorex araneus TaxID=42254 RepID=UPI002433B978|nr:EF-hand and coiled-coil domain-containing protein 1 [Sorex araneus]
MLGGRLGVERRVGVRDTPPGADRAATLGLARASQRGSPDTQRARGAGSSRRRSWERTGAGAEGKGRHPETPGVRPPPPGKRGRPTSPRSCRTRCSRSSLGETAEPVPERRGRGTECTAAPRRGAPRPAGMEGAGGDPYRRPARRTQWLLSALAHHYGLDRGVENEIVVLATGLDQYLQEVFHHLDSRGAGRLPRADFRALCAVLGLRAEGAAAGDAASATVPAAGDAAPDGDADADEEARLALSAEPPELTFRQFHARLCGYFGTRAGPRLPRGALSEHIETQIRLRRPRRRRPAPRPAGPDGGADPEGAARLEEENCSLRELVEDLRAALQSSDARCLALQVGLWKSQAGAHEAGHEEPEAAALELRQARGALAQAEARAGRLRQRHTEVRRRAEEARQAVLLGLRRVRELEALARQVPELQRWGRRLEGELRHYRSESTQRLTSPAASPGPTAKNSDAADGGPGAPEAPSERAWPPDSSCENRALDAAGASPGVDEQLFRSVEGQAASDDEEAAAEKWRESPRPRPPATVGGLLAGLSSCGSRCGDRKLVTYCMDGAEPCAQQLGSPACGRSTEQPPGEEAELRAENEQLRLELRMVEAERVRLSLLEEKLVDALRLLRRLRDLNISRKALGKILLTTLDACGPPLEEGTPGPMATLDALRQALASCELFQGEPLAPAPAAPALPSPLLLSC